MKAKINISGNLEIERAGEFKGQRCPYTRAIKSKSFSIEDTNLGCGEWCPLFGEPRKIQYGNGDAFALNLCHNTLYLSELTDERKSNDS